MEFYRQNKDGQKDKGWSIITKPYQSPCFPRKHRGFAGNMVQIYGVFLHREERGKPGSRRR